MPQGTFSRLSVLTFIVSFSLSQMATAASPVAVPKSIADYDTNCVAVFGGVVKRSGTWYSCEVSTSIKVAHSGLFPTHTLLINKSNIVLDCNGSGIDGKYDELIYGADNHTRDAVQIKTLRGATPPANITVKNCKFQNLTGASVAVWTDLQEADIHDLIMVKKVGHFNGVRARSPVNVVIQNIVSANSGRPGVYFYPGITGARLLDSEISDTGVSKVAGREGTNAPGVYLDASTKNITVQGNLIQGSMREGLAIDSSGDHLVKQNEFLNNGVGSIYLYTNCGERAMLTPLKPSSTYHYSATAFLRLDHASRNRIESNLFQNEEMGIWVASRQSKDLGTWGCADVSPYSNPIAGNKYFYLDHATDNVIRANTFTNVKTGVLVEDDRTNIDSNTFTGGITAISVGTQYRAQYLNKPISGTVIQKNRFFAQTGVPVQFPFKTVNTKSDAVFKKYKGYLTENAKESAYYTNPNDISREEALGHCQWKHSKNPNLGIRCVWGTETILKVAEVVKKIYKGYLIQNNKETPYYTAGNVTRQAALDHCKWKQGKNPTLGIRCVWGTETIWKVAEPKKKK